MSELNRLKDRVIKSIELDNGVLSITTHDGVTLECNYCFWNSALVVGEMIFESSHTIITCQF